MEKENHIKKLNNFKIIVLICLFLLFLRLVYLQVARGAYYGKKAEENMLLQIPIRAPRGIIYDKEGKPLVRNIPSFNVYIVPDQMINYGRTVSVISSILKIDKKNIYSKIKSNSYDKSRSIKIKDNISKQQMFRLEELRKKLPGVYIYMEPIREYMYKSMGSHMFGYISEVNEDEYKRLKNSGYELGDLIGKQGIEKQYESCLRGKNGAQLMQVDSSGMVIKHMGQVRPVNGNNLYLNIDLDLQSAAYKSVLNKINYLKRIGVHNVGASAICMDAKDGKILAFISYPDYDPNIFIKGMTEKQYKTLILDNFFPLLNRGVSTAFPCASIFKIVTSTAALAEGLVKENSILNCPGYYNLGEFTFHCFNRSGHGSINFLEAIAYSCDVVFYYLGEKLGIDKILKYAKNYGLGSPTGIDLDEEIHGLLPDSKWKMKAVGAQWYPGDTINMSIGQGYLQVTPVQVLSMTQMLANNGKRVKPFIAQKIESSEGNIIREFYAMDEPKPEIEINNDIYKIVKKGMGLVTEKGTAFGLNIKEFKIAGKTGTVENSLTQSNPYGRNHTWFTCFAPYDENKSPKIVVIVFFEQSGGFGGSIAAPVAYDIVKCYYDKYYRKAKSK